MKKFLSIALAILMLLPILAGCTQTPAPTPEAKVPETDAPETDAPETDAPETEAPETDAPETDAPETEAPETEAPETDAPETDAPETDAPETEAPETEAPETDAPETNVPETEAPETNVPETEVPETDAPETEAPETAVPETEAPETAVPETEAPETEAPETDAPETEAPETEAPETEAPETEAPKAETPKPETAKEALANFGYYTHTASNGMTIPYRMYVPKDYNRRNEYPVLVIFHSYYYGTDNEKQMHEVRKFFGSDDSPALDCIVIVPQHPSSGGFAMIGESLVYIGINKGWTEEGIDAVVEILEHVNDTYSTDLERQYFTGFDEGGAAVWNMICRHHEKISAAVICSSTEGLIPQSKFKEGNPIVTKSFVIDLDEIRNSGSSYKYEYYCISNAVTDIPIYYLFEGSYGTSTYMKIVEAILPYKKGKFNFREFSDKTMAELGDTYISQEDGYKYLHWLLEQRRETE